MLKRRYEFVSPGVVIGLCATLLAFDLRCAGAQTEQYQKLFWVLGIAAPYVGCAWVGLKHRSEGRGVGRSAWITLVMGAIAGTVVFPVFGTLYGLVYTAIFILPPTLWIAAISVHGFHASREGTIARTIWWRRRWHATVGMCTAAIALRLHEAPATAYAVGLATGAAAIALLCLASLTSLARELAGVLAVPTEDQIDLGVGMQIVHEVAVVGAGPHRTSSVARPWLYGDADKVRAMMRHTLWGAVVLASFATSVALVAAWSLAHGA